MADVRSLLRQQRAIRRIEHPHAAYTDTGKLLCLVCREQIKAESLWDSHVQSEAHARQQQGQEKASGQLRNDAAGAKQKRKLDDDDAEVEVQDAMRRKRSRADLALTPTNGANNGPARTPSSGKDANLKPPGLSRRMSITPSQGIELQIPSRPATPSCRDASATSTPGIAPPSLPHASGSNMFLTPRPVGNSVSAAGGAQASPAVPQVDESEWAAFEADMAAVSYDQDAVISAPAMTAEESAAAKASTDNDGNRRAQADVDIEEEREEATRAIEDEFQDMRDLDQRVQRLKEKREALRRQGELNGQEAAPERPSDPGRGTGDPPGEDAVTAAGAAEVNGQEDEDEDDDDDDDDDWDGFRFRAS